jgi:phosphoserine aminotransferase
MKSYLQGMITGGVLVFATIVLMGQSKWDEELQSEMKEIEKRLLKEKQNRNEKNKDIEVPMRYHFNAAVSNEGILYTWYDTVKGVAIVLDTRLDRYLKTSFDDYQVSYKYQVENEGY